MRRVHSRRCVFGSIAFGIGAYLCSQFDLEAVFVQRSGFVFWLVVALVSFGLGSLVLAAWLARREQPRPVEVLESSDTGDDVIHMRSKQ